MNVEVVMVGDIIKLPEGIRVVELAFCDEKSIIVRPLDATYENRYRVSRPEPPGAWPLLARGTYRWEPGRAWAR